MSKEKIISQTTQTGTTNVVAHYGCKACLQVVHDKMEEAAKDGKYFGPKDVIRGFCSKHRDLEESK